MIHPYKFKLNHLISLYFRKLSQHLEDKNLLNLGCYGGQPNCYVIDLVISDITQTEIAMITIRHLIWRNNDLKQCFDYILSPLAQINHQSFSLPSTLQKFWERSSKLPSIKLKQQWESPIGVIVTPEKLTFLVHVGVVLCKCTLGV